MISLMACHKFPADPNDSLKKIKEERRLEVGVLHNPPWTSLLNGIPKGKEVDLVRSFANKLGVKASLKAYGTDDGIKALKDNKINVLIGGFTTQSPYKKQLGFTRPYRVTKSDGKKHRHVLAVPRGENRLLTQLENFLKEAKK